MTRVIWVLSFSFEKLGREEGEKDELGDSKDRSLLFHDSGLLLLCDRQGHLERISELFLAQTRKRTLYPYAAAVFFVPALANTDYCRVNKSFILFNVTCC